MMRISTAAGSGVLKDQEVVGSLSFGRLSYENADRTWAVTVFLTFWVLLLRRGFLMFFVLLVFSAMGSMEKEDVLSRMRQKLGQLLRSLLVVWYRWAHGAHVSSIASTGFAVHVWLQATWKESQQANITWNHRRAWYQGNSVLQCAAHLRVSTEFASLWHAVTRQVCTGPFLKFLEEGVMAVQVRAYDKGVAAGELDIVKQKLKWLGWLGNRNSRKTEEIHNASQFHDVYYVSWNEFSLSPWLDWHWGLFEVAIVGHIPSLFPSEFLLPWRVDRSQADRRWIGSHEEAGRRGEIQIPRRAPWSSCPKICPRCLIANSMFKKYHKYYQIITRLKLGHL